MVGNAMDFERLKRTLTRFQYWWPLGELPWRIDEYEERQIKIERRLTEIERLLRADD